MALSRPSTLALLLITAALSNSLYAQTNTKATEPSEAKKQIEIISIIGAHQQLKRETGSAYVLTQEQLELFEFDDIHRLLQSVPGVYIREEDGYGLRPNIGLRGATTERSAKITIMEDGILIAPAPYAAPAAYYFPNTARMTGLEVLKGPAAIKFGPNTVGGAINMHSRAISDDNSGELELAYGGDNYQKIHGHYSYHIGHWGVLVEGIRLSSDGFKALDNGGDTGFVKNELMLKLNYQVSDSDYYQLWQLKMAYGDETSHETYLGLTDDDFAKQANRRYVASQNDEMQWQHQQISLSHYIELSDEVSVFTQAYRRDFDRDWAKLNRFNNNRSIQTILKSPKTGLNKLYYEVLTGQRDSSIGTDSLMFGHNDRQYFSQGLQSKLLWQSEHFGAQSQLEVGIRLHQDQVQRHHFENEYLMLNQQLVATQQATINTIINQDKVTAVASYVDYQLEFERLTLSAGLRIESINGQANDKLKGTFKKDTDTLVSPGFGAFYRFNEQLGLLVGINKGFVPNSPAQEEGVLAEESWNYELGLRFANDESSAEFIGFLTDYSNLKGNCTAASGCEKIIGQEFNGGAVKVKGLEASLSTNYQLSESLSVPLAINYTYTQSSFNTGFQSTFIQWGKVSQGDALPYMPKNQWSIETGIKGEQWQIAIIAKHVDKMQETAGSLTDLSGYWTDAIDQIDVSAWLQISKQLRLYGKIDNVSNQQGIVSRRPFGARASKPRQLIVGVKYKF
ncbi:MAG: TonB-dependent receptor [Psychrobium sp.]|nr:TonB-dependent receptor [Psychrobium sp.]